MSYPTLSHAKYDIIYMFSYSFSLVAKDFLYDSLLIGNYDISTERNLTISEAQISPLPQISD
jgi:hypothetical protein